MISIKSIAKRSFALVLTVVMLMSYMTIGITAPSAANVELAPTSYNISAGSCVYFLDTASWDACQMYIWKINYNTYYDLSKIANTKIYTFKFSSKWDGYAGYKFRSDTSWNKQSDGDITGDITGNCYFVGAGTTKNTTMANMNGTAKVVNMISTNGGTSYTAAANTSTYTTVSGYNVANGSSSASTVSAKTTSASSASIEAAYGSTITYTATPGTATFKGFSTTNSSTLPSMESTSTSYTQTASAYGTSDNATVYAYYILKSENKVTLNQATGGTATTSATSVQEGSTVTLTATPSTGYEFNGWTISGTYTPTNADLTSANLTITPTSNITVTPSYDPIKYTYTYYKEDGTSMLGEGTAKYGTKVNTFSNAPAPTKDSTAEYDYSFDGWVYLDGSAVGENDIVTGNVNLKATFKETKRAYTVNYSGDHGDVSVAYADGTVVTSGAKVPYGTELTLSASNPDKFYDIGAWSASVGTVSGNKYTVTGDVTLTHNFKAKTTYDIDLDVNINYEITFDCDGDIEQNGDTFKVEEGAVVDFTIKAPQDYYFSVLAGVNNNNYNVNTYDFKVTADKNQTIKFTILPLPTYQVTVKSNPAAAGRVDGGGEVLYGSVTILTATANEGYKFTGWTASNTSYTIQRGDLQSVSLSIIPNAAVDFTANFEAVSGTINVTAGEGGTVDTKGDTVTYPETVTANATAYISNGYIFTHWSIESEGKKDTDYKVTTNGAKITVQILTDGTVVNVKANFANSQSIKFYTYSYFGFSSLKVTESNGTDTLIPYEGSQSAITFGDETWYTPKDGEVGLTAGYNDSITAQMYGASPLSGGTGKLVIFNNTVGWSSVYLYTSSSSLWNITDANTKGLNAVQMQRIGSTNYYYAYVDSTFTYTLFLEYENNNYERVWQNKAAYRGDYSTSTPMYTPSTTPSHSSSNATNQTTYYNTGSWAAKPTIPTTTNVLDITNILYDGQVWRGLDEVWLYFAANGTTVVGTQRRELNNLVENGAVKATYNKGKNDAGYTDTTWSAFTSAYETAVSVMGTGASTQTQIDNAKTALDTAYKNLKLTETVTITGSHGAMPDFGKYYGKISFPGLTVTSHTGNIGDSDNVDQTKQNCTYYTATVNRDQVITINTTVNDTDLMVFGWVINGTEFVSATQDIGNTSLYTGTYTCSNNAVIVPIYFRKDTIQKYQDGSDDIIKLYAKADDSSTTWGNYMAAYTWTASTYKQFGRWTGQLMIPDVSSPGMYYTYVEKFNPEKTSEVITGITFNNYGNNTGIYTGQRYQAYDYYEFIKLAELGYDNIVFELNESDGVSNWPGTANIDLTNNNYNFYPFVNFSGNMVGIDRAELTEEEKALDPALYIVRTGPCDPDSDGIGQGYADLSGSDFYVNAYVYDSTGKFLVACKTYELIDLDALKAKRGVDLTPYIGKPVGVDYASLTDTSGNKRYDGEWFGTKLGLTNVTISTEIAFLNDDGTVTYYTNTETPNYNELVGASYINGEASQQVAHGSEGHIISANTLNGNDFVGWYLATKNADGTITIDPTVKPLFVERSSVIDASSDAVYVALFKVHPENAFTVNNYYYTYDDFAGQTISPYAPPIFGNDTSYSVRDVQIKKIYDSYDNKNVNIDLGRAGTYTQTMDAISPGDKLEITIYTKPTFSRDYVYAWYIQSNDSFGVNFEEIGTDRAFGSADAGKEQSFTFTYTVDEGVNTLTIFSDVVHVTPAITLTYIYHNRYNEEQKYVVKHTLSDDELIAYAPSNKTIKDNAPVVDDLYKNLEWKIENVSADATNWTLRATETDEYTVIFDVDGKTGSVKGKFNSTVSLYANDINTDVPKTAKGLWYIDKVKDGKFVAGEDEILTYGSYYGLVITGDITVKYVSDAKLVNQIILSDAIYGFERATDAEGNVVTNKVYVDYIINNLLTTFNNGYVDVNENGKQDDNEPTVIDWTNANNPASLDKIEAAGYTVDYGMVLELINTFNASTKDANLKTYYGTDKTNTDKIEEMLAIDAANSSKTGTGYKDTYFYRYSARDFGINATNKNRLLMTFGYDNNDTNRERYYNAVAYLTISNGTDTLYLFSNQATLNIAEADTAATNS